MCRKSGKLDVSLNIGYIRCLKWEKFLEMAALGCIFVYIQIKH